MIAGERCTRACGFCAVSTAKPFVLDSDEPARVAEAIRRMKLKHVVITAVARDDLADGGDDELDAGRVSHLAIRDWHIEVGAQQHALALEVEVVEGFEPGHECHPSAGVRMLAEL